MNLHTRRTQKFQTFWWQGEPQERGEGGNSPITTLIKVQEVQRGQEAPHDGSVVLPKDVRMTPPRLRGLVNSIVNAKLPGGSEVVDGFPSSHPNLDDGHPGLLEHVFRGILVVEIHPDLSNQRK